MAELRNDPSGPSRSLSGEPPAQLDPRAVRVRLSDISGVAGSTSILVAPAHEPLRMANPTVGRGPLGGAAIAPPVEDDAGVLAQRHLEVDGVASDAKVRDLGAGRWILEEPGCSSRVVIEPDSDGSNGSRIREVLVDGFRFLVETESERISALRERASQGRTASAHSGPLQVKAIIPGKVVAISVTAGDTVTAGQQLLVVEAMKMQNELRAPRDGTIDRVGVTVGVNIEIGDLLVVIN